MSTTIDQKVVEMRFDNQQFEKGVATTMDSIKKLEKSLDLTGATKGLENIDIAARNCNMSGLSSAVETVKMKFSALEVMGITALTNITNSAVNAGKRIVSALTIDPVKAGFSEYELKMGSIQTIMASTGEDLETVNGYLNELNEYSDKTIYSFSDMTQNIGKFTNAGVSLKDSVAAIQGVSNVAALSGANANEASRAMYNFSQALSSGYVKLIDWKSIENANMATVEFKNQLLETAAAEGKLTKTSDGMYKTLNGTTISATKNFNDSLQEQWMTSEVLIGTLGKYTDETTEIGKKATKAATEVKTLSQLYDTLKESAQSGWAQTWEIIVGDFEEAKAFMTELSDIFGTLIGNQAESRNEMLENWKVLGGRTALLESLRNVFEGIGSIVKPISEAFREIFPPMTAERLMGLTEGLKNLTARLKISDETSDKLKRTFKGLFAILSIAKTIFTAICKAVGTLLGPIGDVGGGILEVTASFGDWLTRVDDFIKTSGVFEKAFAGIAIVIKNVINIVRNIGRWLYDNLIEPIFGIGDAASGMSSVVSSAFDKMGSSLENCSLFKILKTVWRGITTIASSIAKVLGSLFGGLVHNIGSGDFQGVLDFLNSLIAGGIGIGIVRLINSVKGITDGFGGIVEGFGDVLDGLGGCLEGFQNKLNADALIRIAGAIAILAASLVILSLMDSDKVTDAISAITILVTELMGAMAIFAKISSVGDKSIIGVVKSMLMMQSASTTLIKISVALLIMAAALKVVSTLDWDELSVGLVGITGLIAVLIGAVKILGSGGKAMKRGATQMVILAAAVKILASVCKDLSVLSWKELTKGLLGVGVLLAEVALFMNTAKFSGKAITTGAGMVILAAAIKILASACSDFARMSWSDIAKGLASIAGLLVEVSLFTKITGNAKHVISTGLALIAISAAMKIFASAIQDMSNLSWTEIGKGLTSMAGVLAAVTIAMNLMPTNLIGKGVGLVAVSAALLILSNTLIKMGGVSWESIGKGLVAIGGSLLILAVGLHAMNGTIGGSVALIIATAALAILAPVLKSIGSMSWGSIAKGLVTIAAAFAIIAIAGYALSGAIVPIIGLSVAIALIGVAVLAAGVGLVAFGAGLSALAVGFTALAASIGVVCNGIVEIVSSVVVGIIKGIGEGIVALCDVIIESAPVIGEAIKVLVLTLCDVLIECLPKIVSTLSELILMLLDSLTELAGPLVEKLVGLLVAILEGIANSIEPLVAAALNVLAALLNGVIKGIADLDTDGLLQALTNVGMLAAIVAALAAIAVLTPAAMVGVLGLGAVVTELSIVLAALGAISKIPGLQWLIKEGGNFLQTVGTAVGQFIGGIIGGIGAGLTSRLPTMADNLSGFMDNLSGFIDGAKSIDKAAVDGIKNLAGMILVIAGAEVLEGIASIFAGGSAIAQFAAELLILGAGIKAFSDIMGEVSVEAVDNGAKAIGALAEAANSMPKIGGIAAIFEGEQSMTLFAAELPLLGLGLLGFSKAVDGINIDAVTAGTNAAIGLAGLYDYLPNIGGIAALFTGEQSMTLFAAELPLLGAGLLAFSKAVDGINIDAVTAGTTAAIGLAGLYDVLPNIGGIVSLFTGEQSMALFAAELPLLGVGLLGFSKAVDGISVDAVTAATEAAIGLAGMYDYLPKIGGIKALWEGENSMALFAAELPLLGVGLLGFSKAVDGIIPTNVTAAADAAVYLAQVADALPTTGGVFGWFKGDTDWEGFKTNIPKVGEAMKAFSDAVTGITPANVTAAADAAKALAGVAAALPTTGGLFDWATSDTDWEGFKTNIPKVGEAMKAFSDAVTGITPANVTAAADAAKSLGEMANTIPKDTKKITSFGDNLVKFGDKLKAYFDATSAITAETVSATNNIVSAVKDVANINASGAKSASEAITKLTKAIKGTEGITGKSTSGFVEALKNLASVSADAFIKSFEDITKKMKEVGKEAIEAFVKGVTDNTKTAKTAGGDLAEAVADAAGESVGSFETAGKDLVEGFANGISKNAYLAEAKARAMAAAAAKAAKEELDEHSPSKVGYEIGDFFGIAFVNAIGDNIGAAYDASSEMASSAKSGLGDAIARIADFINSDMDAEPTIRPVLDLSNVKSGMHTLGRMMNIGSDVGVLANVGAIHAGMSLRGQNGDVNGTTNNSNVTNNTYIIDGVTYDDGSNVANAMEEIVHAAKVERRT